MSDDTYSRRGDTSHSRRIGVVVALTWLSSLAPNIKALPLAGMTSACRRSLQYFARSSAIVFA
jgi:hypothetical protein